MYKSELVIYLPKKDLQRGSVVNYTKGGFRQASIVGSSTQSKFHALADAYRVAREVYNVSYEQVKEMHKYQKNLCWNTE
jgi:hypothetical protein